MWSKDVSIKMFLCNFEVFVKNHVKYAHENVEDCEVLTGFQENSVIINDSLFNSTITSTYPAIDENSRYPITNQNLKPENFDPCDRSKRALD